MNTLRTIIETYRKTSNEYILAPFKCTHNGKSGYDAFDAQYWIRKELIVELYSDYTISDKPLIKWLLQEEQKGIEFDIPLYTTDICAFMLYKHMSTDDVYELFHAKFGGKTDRQIYLDIELIFGFDRIQMKEYLKNKSTNIDLNKEILKTIEYYESNPDASFKSREEYIQYFETKKINIIRNHLESTEDFF